MDEQTDFLAIHRKLVMIVDICSSTAIVDALKKTDSLRVWRNALTSLKRQIVSGGFTSGIAAQPYKFVGDGWILLFEPNIEAKRLFDYMLGLCTWYSAYFESNIEPVFEKPLSPDHPTGLMFGIDTGDLIWLKLDSDEYIGRAINVAARLQGETKNVEGGPSNCALLSKPSFNSLKLTEADKAKVEALTIQLRGISDEYHCFVHRILRANATVEQSSLLDAILPKLADAFERGNLHWVPIQPSSPAEEGPLRQLMSGMSVEGLILRQNFADGPYQLTSLGYKRYLARIKGLRTLPRWSTDAPE